MGKGTTDHMLKTLPPIMMLCVIAGCRSHSAQAPLLFTEIVQPQLTPYHSSGFQILSHSPIGQTFTAEHARITYIGFAISDMNPDLPVVPINIELFEGEGTDGTLLGTAPLQTSSDPLSLPGRSSNPRFLEADFSFTTLKVGRTYTALLTTSNGRAGVYAEYSKRDYDGSILQPDLYTGGYGFTDQTQYPSYKGEFDFVFRVTFADRNIKSNPNKN